MNGTLKSRLQALQDPLQSAVYLRTAEWLEDLPEEQAAEGILLAVYAGDLDALKRNEPDFRDMTDEQISEVLREQRRRFTRFLREQARDLRGRRR